MKVFFEHCVYGLCIHQVMVKSVFLTLSKKTRRPLGELIYDLEEPIQISLH